MQLHLFDKVATHIGSLINLIAALKSHYRFISREPPGKGHRPVVFISLSHNKLRRYSYPLVMALLKDYDVRIAISFSFLGRLFDCEKYLLQTNGVQFTLRRPRNSVVILRDRNRQGGGRCPQVFINRDYFNRFNDNSPNVLHFPFPMHPDRYQPCWINKDAAIAGRIRILFAGNTDARYYNDPGITGRFGLLSRTRLASLVKEQFGDRLLLPRSFEELREALAKKGNSAEIVLIESGSIVPANQFLSLLGRADFFLALPGTKVPHCHNCIEAMSCGCIPILQYGGLFPHPLVDNVNSLHYHTSDDFIRVLRRVIGMSKREIEIMSSAANTYYRDFLSHESFMREFNDKIKQHTRLELIINAERRSL